jgi:hypothetical protein
MPLIVANVCGGSVRLEINVINGNQLYLIELGNIIMAVHIVFINPFVHAGVIHYGIQIQNYDMNGMKKKMVV